MKIKNFLYYFLIALMIASVVMSIMIFIKPPVVLKYVNIAASATDEIVVDKNTSLEQHFQSQVDSIMTVEIFIDSIEKNSNLKVEVFADDQLVYEKTYRYKELEAERNKAINFSNFNNIRGKDINLKLSTDNGNISFAKAPLYNKNQYLVYNGKKYNESVKTAYLGQKENKSFVVHFLLFFVTSLILFIFLKDERKD